MNINTSPETISRSVTQIAPGYMSGFGNSFETEALPGALPVMNKAAVEMAIKGRNAVMPAITRVADKPYRWKITEAPLTKVANVEKMLPRDFIAKDGYGITAKARAYLGPLMKGEDPPPYKDGLPQYVRLKNVAVAKKLARDFKI